MVKHAFSPDREPAARFSNELTRTTNQKQMENVRVSLTSVEQRLRDMDKMGVDVQAISCSPFQFKYSLDPELGQKAARAINEHLAEIVRKHPLPVRGPRQRTAASARRRCRRARLLRQEARLPRRGDRDQRGRRRGLARPGRLLGQGPGAGRHGVHSCIPTASRGVTGSPTITSSTSSAIRSTPRWPSLTWSSTGYWSAFLG